MCPCAAPLLALLLSAAMPPARAAAECRYSAEHGPGARTTTRQISIGEIDRPALAGLARVRNDGAHDIRVTFDGAAPRLLARAQSEPAAGRFAHPVVLRGVECLASRSARRFDSSAFAGRSPAGNGISIPQEETP